jgi:hypothetical protein
MRKTKVLGALAIAFLLGAAVGRAAEDSTAAAKVAAQKAAETWLAGVDKGGYAASWDEAAPMFQRAIKKDAWESALGQVRKPLGAVKTRTFKAAQYTTDLPRAPRGEYVVLQFKATFENGEAGVETITLMLAGGTWRVAGYFIK